MPCFLWCTTRFYTWYPSGFLLSTLMTSTYSPNLLPLLSPCTQMTFSFLIVSPQHPPSRRSNQTSLPSHLGSPPASIHSTLEKLSTSHKSPAYISSHPTLTLDGTPLELVSTYKYLGVTITSNLSWSPHIHSICAKDRKTIGLIYRTLYNIHLLVHSSDSTLLLYFPTLHIVPLCGPLPPPLATLKPSSKFNTSL